MNDYMQFHSYCDKSTSPPTSIGNDRRQSNTRIVDRTGRIWGRPLKHIPEGHLCMEHTMESVLNQDDQKSQNTPGKRSRFSPQVIQANLRCNGFSIGLIVGAIYRRGSQHGKGGAHNASRSQGGWLDAGGGGAVKVAEPWWERRLCGLMGMATKQNKD